MLAMREQTEFSCWQMLPPRGQTILSVLSDNETNLPRIVLRAPRQRNLRHETRGAHALEDTLCRRRARRRPRDVTKSSTKETIVSLFPIPSSSPEISSENHRSVHSADVHSEFLFGCQVEGEPRGRFAGPSMWNDALHGVATVLCESRRERHALVGA